ncbi:hypothetical protein [Micromonospora wenchangensis]|uniref:hypothetical protein n=1 Tax=Micromonospora wenchangensis TaxID=1185415 RepID=UPI003816CC2E
MNQLLVNQVTDLSGDENTGRLLRVRRHPGDALGGGFSKGGRLGVRLTKAGWKVGKRVAKIGWKGCRSNWRKCGSRVGGEVWRNGWAATIGGDLDNLRTAGRFWRDRVHDWGARGYNTMFPKLGQWTRGLSRSSCGRRSYRWNWAW